MTRYAFDDLWAMLAPESESQCAAMIGLTPSGVRGLRGRMLDEKRADKYAVAAGLVPYEVWPALTDAVVADAYKACDECGEPYVPRNRVSRFCSSRCQHKCNDRRRKRDRYRNDPEFRKGEQQRVKAYKELYRDAVIAQERRRYRGKRAA